MKLLKLLFLNRFILSILVIALFAFDYSLVKLNPFSYYSLSQPTVPPSEYYEVEFGSPTIYVKIYYEGNRIHLVPTDDISGFNLIKVEPILSWYYYGLILVIVNIFPFGLFNKSKKKESKKKRK